MALSNCVMVEVTKTTPSVTTSTWSVTFLTEYGDHAAMVPTWDGNSCTGCTTFDQSGAQVVVTDNVIQGCESAATCKDPQTHFWTGTRALVTSGVATFEGLRIDKLGHHYTLRFTVATITAENHDTLQREPSGH